MTNAIRHDKLLNFVASKRCAIVREYLFGNSVCHKQVLRSVIVATEVVEGTGTAF